MSFDVAAFSESEFYSRLTNDYLHQGYIKYNPDWFRQAVYLAGYLDHLNARTIVVEQDYVDRDYMADYSSYYASCFDSYGPHCRRLHFFKSVFEAADLQRWIDNRSVTDDTALNEAYLGFVVVRPLPEAVVGRTALRTYDDPSIERYYRAVRTYEVDLFGIPLSVMSLAYQQQDTVVAACATVALWSAFHKASTAFHSPLLRPTEITTAANSVQGGSRAMPSGGLRVEQICAAIRRAHLEPLAEKVTTDTLLMSIFYGYLEFDLPLILLGLVAEAGYEGHAVTVTGYALANGVVAPTESMLNGVCSVGQRIEKIYLHDDNLGPFARTVPIPVPSSSPRKSAPFALQEQDAAGNSQFTIVPVAVIVPVYEKIRLTYSAAHTWVGHLCFALGKADFSCDLIEWRIGLTTTQKYKQLVRQSFAHNPDARALLTESLPRFMWRAVGTLGDRIVLEMLIDATGLSRSCPVIAIIWHDASSKTIAQSGLEKIPKSAVADIFTQRFTDALYT